MKISKKFVFGSLVIGVCASVGAALAVNGSSKTVQVAADDDVSYSVRTGFTAYADDTVAWGTPWGIEGINTYEFTAAGQGVNLADSDGKLPTFNSEKTGTEFEDPSLSLFTYPMFHNSSMFEDGHGYVNQYPLGWKMADNVSDPTTVSAWPRGYCSADRHYLKYYYDYSSSRAAFHPGVNCGAAIYFTAPSAGTIWLKDSMDIENALSDGTYFAIYKISAANVTESSWNSCVHHGLFGAEPIYPNKGVNVTSDWNTWKKVAYGTTTHYYTENYTVAAGDQIVWILGSGPTNSYDVTKLNPTVVYGTSPVNEAREFEQNYVYKNIAYTDGSETTACLTSYGEAQTAYASLSDRAKSVIQEYDEFANCRARLSAWAAANGTTSFVSGSSSLNAISNNGFDTTALIAASVAAGCAAAGLLFASRKRRTNK